MEASVAAAHVEPVIRFIRGQKVILDSDLAALYGVPTKALNRAVRRNRKRFPPDFMFPITRQEVMNLRCQIGTSSLDGPGGRRYLPFAFTEQGVAMLSGLLNSPRAIAVNIEIMRAFVRLRGILAAHKDLARRLDELEARYDDQFKAVFEAIRHLLTDAYAGEQVAFSDGTVPLRWIDLTTGNEKTIVRVNVRTVCTDGVLRVDSHPAWDRTWRYVAFNGFVDGTRRVFVADMQGLAS